MWIACGRKFASRLGVVQDELEGGIVIILKAMLREKIHSFDQIVFIGVITVIDAYRC